MYDFEQPAAPSERAEARERTTIETNFRILGSNKEDLTGIPRVLSTFGRRRSWAARRRRHRDR
jgi:hypothetical protein